MRPNKIKVAYSSPFFMPIYQVCTIPCMPIIFATSEVVYVFICSHLRSVKHTIYKKYGVIV